MLQLIIFLFVGALLVASLVLLARRGDGPEGGAEVLVRTRQALTQLQTNLLSPEVAARFSSVEDFEYVSGAAPAGVYNLFCSERKKIMLAWIEQVRQQCHTLLRFHFGAARFYTRLSFRSEVFLAMDFASLLAACRALQILVYFGGPLAAPRLMGAVAAAGLRICGSSERALAFLNSPEPPIESSIAS
jgi:hypothetical protein